MYAGMGAGADVESVCGVFIADSGCFTGGGAILLGMYFVGVGAGAGRVGTRVGDMSAGMSRSRPKKEIR